MDGRAMESHFLEDANKDAQVLIKVQVGKGILAKHAIMICVLDAFEHMKEQVEDPQQMQELQLHSMLVFILIFCT